MSSTRRHPGHGVRRGVRARKERVRSLALLLRRVDVGEADWVTTLFTAEAGVVSAVARSARRSTKRFTAVEPMHLLAVVLDERAGVDMATLVETSIARPRIRLVSSLERLEAAGRALRWVRRALPHRAPEPEIWRELNALLDAYDDDEAGEAPAPRLAAMGLRLLVAIGYGLDFERCVRCGRPCDAAASAYVDAAAGGLVCRVCGGGGVLLRAERRARFIAATSGDDAALDPDDAAVAIDLVEAALAAHTGRR